MSPAVTKCLWELSQRLWGDEHPLTRARFGRYVAARGGYLTLASAGLHAWVAWERAGKNPGTMNQADRARLGWVRTRPTLPSLSQVPRAPETHDNHSDALRKG